MKTTLFFVTLILTTLTLSMAQDSGLLPPNHLRVEDKANPLGIDAEQPRFSWWVQDIREDAVQSAYRVQVKDATDQWVWDSKKVETDQSTYVPYGGLPLQSGERYHWRVQTWNGDDASSGWSDWAWFEMGLREAGDWKAKWIGHPPRFTKRSPPAVYLREVFALTSPVAQARLYISARGLYEAHLNGERVGEDIFAPGWTDYGIRNQYLTYDVTAQLQVGENTLGIILGDGWYTGNLKWKSHRNWYGEDTSLLAQLVVETKDGRTILVTTGDGWKVATGPIVESDFYNGEKYDARAELEGWLEPGYDDSHWLAPRLNDKPTGALVAKVIEPVRRQESLPAVALHRAPDGDWVFDFGQNLVGWVKLRTRGHPSRTVTLRFAEMLKADGSLYLENMRNAEVTDRYTFKDREPVEWEPKFTFHGFRYVGINGLMETPGLDSVEAVVLHTDAPVTGEFSCSNPLLNQLQSNIVWGQKGNYLEVPTDCPQRDERLGWTGDAQVFVRTATFNMQVSPFFEKWMTDMRDAQLPDGQVPFIIPRLDGDSSSPAWSDAVTICPTVIYERYGNIQILADNFEAMKAWTDYQEANSDNLIFPKGDQWGGFGDWLAVDAPNPGDAPTPKQLIGTAYFAHGAKLVAEVARALGKVEEGKRYEELSKRVKSAFNRRFVTAAGRLTKETQTGYLLALGFDLLPVPFRDQAINTLVADIESRGWHLSTGFVGTGLLMPVLSKAGRNDVAYKVLLQETYPGWLYSIKQGATTMWERWNSYSHEDGFGDAGMNSFNHYAYGAVGEWLYAVIGGIDALEPGFKKILIRPQPGGGLTWAKARLDSPYGPIETSWEIKNRDFHLQVTIPPNTTARIELPGGKVHEVGAGTYAYVDRVPRQAAGK